ncbi:MAG: CRTAC1 family protein [Betaproteobacteria bacterium]|nr:CRTAC1 family protein [Betaproteobacteria bacterium]
MTWRKLTGGLAALLVLLALAACAVLVAGEAKRPPPPGLADPVLAAVDVPFVHRWSRATSHPLLAAAAIDIDGDGRDEVFLGGSDGQPDALIAWRDGKLVDIAAQAGIGDTEATYGALSLDLDGDGRVDLLTVGHAGLILWLNRNGRFERKPIAVKLPDDAVPMAVAAGDYDRDGHVDLYLSMFVAPKLFRSPVFNDPAHAKRNILLRNEGGLVFRDVTDAVTGGLQNTFTASFVDLDRDGWLDLVLAQNTGEAEILRNLGNGKFARLPLRTGFGFWMGLAFGDLHGDGNLDIFLSNAGNSIPAWLTKGDRRDEQKAAHEWLLLRNEGGMRFTDITMEAGVSGFGFGWGGFFEDINLDGVLDLLVAENYVKWPVHRLFKLPGKVLLGARGASPRFYTSSAGSNESYGHVPLIADLDGDGRNDILWANMDGRARAYLNRTEGRFLAVRLPDGPVSIGARVRLEGVRAPVRHVIAGEGLTSDRTAQFTIGVPQSGSALSGLVIEWPGGKVTRIANPQLNKTIVVDAP